MLLLALEQGFNYQTIRKNNTLLQTVFFFFFF
jgi:hypothetical protein